jgi:hypothetical protein
MMQLSIEDYIKTARYEGPVNAADCARLEGQTLRIYRLMIDGTWRTLEEIQRATGDPQASISAQLRHLRKGRFGAHIVDKRRRETQWEYRLQRRDA